MGTFIQWAYHKLYPVSTCGEIYPEFQLICQEHHSTPRMGPRMTPSPIFLLISQQSSKQPLVMAPITWSRSFLKGGERLGWGSPRGLRREGDCYNPRLLPVTTPRSTPQALGSLLPSFAIYYTAKTRCLQSLNLSLSMLSGVCGA